MTFFAILLLKLVRVDAFLHIGLHDHRAGLLGVALISLQFELRAKMSSFILSFFVVIHVSQPYRSIQMNAASNRISLIDKAFSVDVWIGLSLAIAAHTKAMRCLMSCSVELM